MTSSPFASTGTGMPVVGDPGRPVATLEAVVEHGDARGRLLGFPTANLACDVVPVADGVWTATVQIDQFGPSLAAAVSIGRRGTFYAEGVRLVEVHLLDFNGDIYDRTIRVDVYEHLRSQRRFDGVDALRHQLRVDVRRTQQWATSRTGAADAQPTVPPWALRRTAGVLRGRAADRPWPDAAALARRTGISKSLAKRCLAVHAQQSTEVGSA